MPLSVVASGFNEDERRGATLRRGENCIVKQLKAMGAIENITLIRAFLCTSAFVRHNVRFAEEEQGSRKC